MNALSALVCGPVRSREHGPVEKVVASGGYDGRNALSKTEIYDIATDTWSEGTPLPMPLANAAVVSYETTFLVIGGLGNGFSDKVYLYTASGDWQEFIQMKLSQARSELTAMLVPSSLFN